jgi:carboxyl-terminal processing protease
MARKLIRGLSILFALITAVLCFALGYAIYPLLNPPLAAVDSPAPQDDPANLQVFWEAWHILNKEYYGDQPGSTKRVYGAIQGLAQSYGDPFTFFLEPEVGKMEAQKLDGIHGDIGADLEKTELGFVLHPLPAQTADQAGMVEGDRLVQVDDTPLTLDMSLEDVQTHVRGEIGSAVDLYVQRPGDPTAGILKFSLTREEKQTPTLEWRLLDDNAETATVGYIKQSFFSDRSAAEMHVALADLTAAGADRILLDLRNNPGGMVDAAVAIADIWLDQGPLLIERDADGSEKVFEAHPGGEATTVPLTVLVDSGTASAGEIVAGALQDHARAQLVGEKTYGKGSVQLVYTLSDQSKLHVTHAQWFTPNRRQISGLGLTPDVVTDPGIDPIPQAVALLNKVAGQPPHAVAGRK